MLIGVDHGNKQIKTVHGEPFVSGLQQSLTRPFGQSLQYYNTHFSDDPQPLKVPAIDRAAIEAIVREIMRQDEQASDKAVSTGESSPPKKNKIALPPQEQTTEPSEGASEVDDMTRNLIASTMAAFRRNG